jgi:hypothetical protein
VNPEVAAMPAAPVPSVAAPVVSAPTPTPAAPSPASQLGGAFVTLGTQGAPQQITVHLAPPELGRVDVRVAAQPDGISVVQITAERPETLQLLLHDQPQLQHALSQAGVVTEGQMTFHLAAAASDAAPGAALAAQPGEGGGQGATQQAATGHAGTNQGGGERPGTGSMPQDARPGGLVPLDELASTARSFRAGIDILA